MSLYDWCDSWNITTDEFDEFLALAVDNAEVEEITKDMKNFDLRR